MRKIAVLMGGGKGTRFWPMSVESQPKQFLRITSEKSMLQETAERVKPVVGEENIWVVTTSSLADRVRQELPFIEDRIIEEPFGKNTAPAVLLSMRILLKEYDDFNVAFLPADHHIRPAEIFARQLEACFQAATEEIVTMGIPPSRPETGYGYIKVEKEKYTKIGGFTFFKALGFTEKPSRERAEQMLKEGNYFWNSGIFVWNAKIFLQKLAKFSPTFYNIYEEMGRKNLVEVYREVEPMPIDKAFMEALPSFLMSRAEFSWSDLGSWHSLWEVLEKDEQGNVSMGDAILHEASGTLVVTTKKTVVIGVKDLAIVESPHGLLVMRKDAAPHLKKIIEKEVKKNDKVG